MIPIRMLQHYLYCPRRYALLNEDAWSDNFFTVRADIIHERVHSREHEYSSCAKKVFCDVSVYNDEYDIYGKLDCLEFVKDPSGADVFCSGDKYSIRIIEYKATAPKGGFRQADALQLFAQKVCVDRIWKSNAQCYLYYADTHRREKIPFDDDVVVREYDGLLKTVISGINSLCDETLPAAVKSVKCNGCSLADNCKVPRGAVDFRSALRNSL